MRVALRPNTYGDQVMPPRQLYFFLFPPVLGFGGILCWAMGDQAGLVLGSAVATLIAFYTLWDWLFCGAPTRFSTLMAMALLQGYGFGTLNTWATLPRGKFTLAEVASAKQGVLAEGLAWVLVSAALLYFLGEIFETPLFRRNFRLTIDARIRALVFAGVLVILAGYATHVMAFEGVASSQGRISPFGAFVGWLYTPITAIAVAAFATAPSLKSRVLTGASAVVLLIFLSVLGRRVAIYTSMEIIFVLGLVGYRWKARILRNMILLLVLGAIVVAGSLGFMLFRIAGSLSRQRSQSDLKERFAVAQRLEEKGEAFSMAATESKHNIASRTFILPFLSNILDASSRQTPLLGRDAFTNLMDVIPGSIYPEKSKYLITEEQMVDSQFGFSYGDEANSILTAGASDFGFMGMVLDPLIMIMVVRIAYSFFVMWFKPVPLLLITLAMILALLQTETTLAGYFEAIRDQILFGGLAALFMAIPRFRLGAKIPTWRARTSYTVLANSAKRD